MNMKNSVEPIIPENPIPEQDLEEEEPEVEEETEDEETEEEEESDIEIRPDDEDADEDAEEAEDDDEEDNEHNGGKGTQKKDEEEEDDDMEVLGEEEMEKPKKKGRKKTAIAKNNGPEIDPVQIFGFGEGDEDDADDENEDIDAEDEFYLQKFEKVLKHNVLTEHHPELVIKNHEEIETLSKIVRDERGVICDPYHKTLPYVTKYEKARLIGERAKQINAGSEIFVKIESDMIDGYLIALEEFRQKRIPFIIQRPLPNGNCEYWRFCDLEQII